ncbi:hypothetical protein AVHY2522_19575 [Acidovorax sp. SUPP2522]|uniref:hypothetical protein n=1 Tax=unclassified Acidovorax TaxID=2684926 RepID=UPI002349BA30|nr:MULTISPECIES: hypothetical protein [unclassified Acidovorax]WCM96515.1 hypothetical protein M5C96_19085 [Acidovorax sp. GBBC 1281]GKT18638.1 hypothetical protein AVHY2522_19575 [Acidovorax sp. SUPP2522]
MNSLIHRRASVARSALTAAFLLAGASAFAGAADEAPRVPAIKLYNTPDHKAAFMRGTVPALHKIQSQQFWLSQSVEAWEQNTHPAPRRQYVIPLQGELEFRVGDGSTFRLAPGTVLLAEDTEGEGHSWKMVSNDKAWVRVYIPMVSENDEFEPQK